VARASDDAPQRPSGSQANDRIEADTLLLVMHGTCPAANTPFNEWHNSTPNRTQ
jgi:hypothetical protein